MDLGPFWAFLVATSVGLGLSVVTYLVARRAGLAPIQAALIDTLQDNAAALSVRVGQLEAELTREREQRIALGSTLAELRLTVADLASENASLRRQLGAPPR